MNESKNRSVLGRIFFAVGAIVTCIAAFWAILTFYREICNTLRKLFPGEKSGETIDKAEKIVENLNSKIKKDDECCCCDGCEESEEAEEADDLGDEIEKILKEEEQV